MQRRRPWLRFLIIAVAAAIVGFGTYLPAVDAQDASNDDPAAVPQRIVNLHVGFNGFTFTGPDGSAPDSILDGLADPTALDAVFAFDASTGAFDVWRPGPTFLNTLADLSTQTAVFLKLARPTTWTGPAPPQVAETLPLVHGFNLVPYLGTHDAAPAAVLNESIDAVFWLNPATQTFETYRRDAPAIVNSLKRLPRYGVLWVQAQAESTWHQPAYSGGPTLTAVIPPIIPFDADRLTILGERLGNGPRATLAGRTVETTVICDGRGVSLTIDGELPGGTFDVQLTTDGVTTAASIVIGPLDQAALLLATQATRVYVEQCVTDPGARADLLAAIDDVELQATLGDYAAAFDALETFATTSNDTDNLSASDREALQALSELQGTALAELDGGLFDRLGALLGIIPFLGIPF